VAQTMTAVPQCLCPTWAVSWTLPRCDLREEPMKHFTRWLSSRRLHR